MPEIMEANWRKPCGIQTADKIGTKHRLRISAAIITPDEKPQRMKSAIREAAKPIGIII